MRIPIVALAVALVVSAGCGDHRGDKAATPPSTGQYLFVWAGDSAEKESDFITVIDASPSSPRYGTVVTTLPTGVAGSHPHHTEDVIAPNGHLLANGFHAGRTWLFDLSSPTAPKIVTRESVFVLRWKICAIETATVQEIRFRQR